MVLLTLIFISLCLNIFANCAVIYIVNKRSLPIYRHVNDTKRDIEKVDFPLKKSQKNRIKIFTDDHLFEVSEKRY